MAADVIATVVEKLLGHARAWRVAQPEWRTPDLRWCRRTQRNPASHQLHTQSEATQSATGFSKAPSDSGDRAERPNQPTARRLRVILLMRQSQRGLYSMDRAIGAIHRAFPGDIEATIVHLPRDSRGLIPRLINLMFTAVQRADIVHVTGDVHYCALAVRRHRCVLTVHDLVSNHRLRGVKRKLFFLLWYRLPVWWAGRVTTISRATRNELLTWLPSAAAKTTVIPDAIGQEFFGAKRTVQQGGTPRVLQVGTRPNKNLERVVRALDGMAVHLRIIGAISEQQLMVLERANLSYSVASNLSDMEMLSEYIKSDLLVFVSTYEGFGLPIIEAQAVGLPVITSNVSSMPEVAGSGALLVDPLDEGAIRAAVCLLLQSPTAAASLVSAAYENVPAYTPWLIADRYARLYRSLVN